MRLSTARGQRDETPGSSPWPASGNGHHDPPASSLSSLWRRLPIARRRLTREGERATAQTTFALRPIGVMAIVFDRVAIRRPLGLPAIGLHARLPRLCPRTVSSRAPRRNRPHGRLPVGACFRWPIFRWVKLGHRLHVNGHVRCKQAACRHRQLMADICTLKAATVRSVYTPLQPSTRSAGDRA